jgi:hypothetical protein
VNVLPQLSNPSDWLSKPAGLVFEAIPRDVSNFFGNAFQGSDGIVGIPAFLSRPISAIPSKLTLLFAFFMPPDLPGFVVVVPQVVGFAKLPGEIGKHDGDDDEFGEAERKGTNHSRSLGRSEIVDFAAEAEIFVDVLGVLSAGNGSSQGRMHVGPVSVTVEFSSRVGPVTLSCC